MSMVRSLIRPRERALMSIDAVADLMRAGGYVWGGNGWSTTLGSPKEEITGDFVGLTNLYRANPIVFGAVKKRMEIFAQARFRFRQLRDGEPGKTFGTTDLALLEHPEPTLSTSDLLMRALLDVDLAGNWFGIRRPGRIKRVRPDWVYIVKGNPRPDGDIDDVDTEMVGIIYQAGGPYSDHRPEAFAVGEYAHFAPLPDPTASYRGMSWVTTIIREAQADQLMTTHKTAFLEHGATPNVLVKYPPTMPKDKALEWKALFEQEHEGAFNAYRTIYLGGGTDLTVVGSSMQQMDFKAIQGAGETRIALASGVPAVLLQISEGLQGSSLNAGNYAAAKKAFADGPMRHLWSSMSGALEDILPPGVGAELWYDETRIPFLAEDAEAAANVLNLKSTAMRTLWDGGADPDSAIKAINTGDLTHLKHTGKPSVQLQEGGAPPPDDGSEAPVEPEAAPEAALAHGELLAYTPGQPRKSDGKFGTGGAGKSTGSGGGGGGADVDEITNPPSVPIDKWGKGPTVAPDVAVGNLMDGKPANVTREDVRPALDRAAELDDKAKASGDAAELARVRNADLTDLQVAGTLDFGGDGLNIARADMPQFTGKQPDGTEITVLPQFLEHVTKDNDWKVETGTTQDPHAIQPSQREISIAKVGGMTRSTRAGTMKRTAEIVISQDPKTGEKFVIDGHHGWGVATAMKYDDPTVTLKATVIHAPVRAVLKDALDFTAEAGIARQGMTTSTADQKKAAVDAAWEAWALRNPDRVDPPPQPLWQVIQMATGEVRCPQGHLVAEMATPPYRFTCRNCKAVVEESGRWAVTTDPKVVSYSPSQPRKSDGKFGTGGGAAGSGASSGDDNTAADPPTVADYGRGFAGTHENVIKATAVLAKGQFNDPKNARLEEQAKREAMVKIGADLDAAFPDGRKLSATLRAYEDETGGAGPAPGQPFRGATLGERVADKVLESWSSAAYDVKLPSTVALQHAVASEFKTGNRTSLRRDLASVKDEVDAFDRDVLRTAVRSMHTHTQKRLDDLGVAPNAYVGLVRGVGARSGFRGERGLSLNPASSWTTDVRIASSFAGYDQGALLHMSIPRGRILSFPGTGIGARPESEVVVLRHNDDIALGLDP